MTTGITPTESDVAGSEETILSGFQARIFDPRKTNLLTRILLVLTILQVIAVAILFAFGHLFPADTVAPDRDPLPPIGVPLIVFVLVAASLAVGSLVGIVSIATAEKRFRFWFIVGIIILFGAYPLYNFINDLEFAQVFDYLVSAIEPALALFVVLVLAITASGILGRLFRPFRQGWPLWIWTAFWLSAYYLLPMFNPAYYGVGSHTVGLVQMQAFTPTIALVGFTYQAIYLTYVLSFVFILAGTDLAELSEALGKGLLRVVTPQRLRRLHPYIACLVFLLATGGILWDVLNRLGLTRLSTPVSETTLMALGAAMGVALVGVLCARLARISERWPRELPTHAIFASAVFYFSVIGLIAFMGNILQALNDETSHSVTAKEFYAKALLVVVVFVLGIFKLRSPRLVPGSWQSMNWFLLTLTALMAIPRFVPSALVSAGVHMPQISDSDYLAALQLVLALGALGYVIYVAIRTHLALSAVDQFSSALWLIFALEVLHWSVDSSTYTTYLGLGTGVAAAGVLLLAILWDILSSGQQTTNSQQSETVINARTRLYLTYIILASATILYFASLRIAGTQLASGQTDSSVFNGFANLGLLYLGVPFIMQAFFRRVGRWHAEQYPAPQKASSGPLAGARQEVHDVAVRMRPLRRPLYNLFVFFLALSVIVMIPVLLNTGTFLTYRIPVPGQGCTTQTDAEWTYAPGTYICEPHDVRIEVPSGKSVGGIGFHTITNHFTQNYVVGVTADLSHLTFGCVMILTHKDASHDTYIENYYCTNAQYGSRFCRGALCAQLSLGQIQKPVTASLKAVVNWQTISFSINGQKLSGSWSDYDGTSSIDILLTGSLANYSAPIGYVTLRDFTYTPL